jgi:hypothetical protein
MSQRNILKIIENEIQELHIERKILYNNYENIIRELGEHLKLMEMPDDRQINKISVVHRIDDREKKTLELYILGFLKFIIFTTSCWQTLLTVADSPIIRDSQKYFLIIFIFLL